MDPTWKTGAIFEKSPEPGFSAFAVPRQLRGDFETGRGILLWDRDKEGILREERAVGLRKEESGPPGYGVAQGPWVPLPTP